MNPPLPPFPGLQAFEATARHLNFTRAALELGITQAAVSHRIKHLEDVLATKLFTRDGNSVALTEAAQDFLSSIRAVLGELRLATERLGHHDKGNSISIACTGSFSVKCLIPLLPEFRKRYPDVNIKIRKLSSLDHRRSDFDVAIQYGKGDLVGRAVERICKEEVFPVCSPLLMTGATRLQTPADLSRQTIIRVVSPVFVWDEWPRWLDEAGYPDTKMPNEMLCDVFYPSIQAAIAGLGVLMGRNILVQHDLNAGQVVEPFNTRLTTDSSYYLLLSASAERERRQIVIAFRDWLIEAVDKSLSRKSHSALRTSSQKHNTALLRRSAW